MKGLRVITFPLLTVLFLRYTVFLVMLTGMLWLAEGARGAWRLMRSTWPLFRQHVERKHDEICKRH